ncbi:MAG: hypothetical protein IKC11_06165 [Clostridia bacterium]|nr:hypothetical protein [Clostridia bacterium]
MEFEKYATALTLYSKHIAQHEKNCQQLTTAKIFAELCTQRVLNAKGREKTKQIKIAKQKQEQYGDVVENYNSTYEKCRGCLLLATKCAPSSKTKQDVLDTLTSLDSKHLSYRDVCSIVSRFLEADMANLKETEEEPANA